MAEATCPGCQHRDAVIALLHQQVEALEARVRDLEARLGRNAANSSLPPSANPPQAPKPVTKAPTGRRSGGQPGHPPATKLRLPPERVQAVVRHFPTACRRCHAPLAQDPGPAVPPPTWHQVAELPPVLVHVTEHQGHARTCAACGVVTRAVIPGEVRAHTLGPRLTGVMAYLRGAVHAGQRGVEDLVETVFGLPLGLGTVTNAEREVSQALAPAHAEAMAAVQAAPVKNADETGWKQAGRRCWLWVAATATIAAFIVHARRGWAGLQTLLGPTVRGVVCSDRWSAYQRLPLAQRQLCWAHLKRDFQGLVDAGGAAAVVGRALLAVVGPVFDAWHAFRGGGLDRAGLQARLKPWQAALHQAVKAGLDHADDRVMWLCAHLWDAEPALWTFATVDGVEPTNNHAERVLRPAVLWRKNSFGSHSEAGCRFAERLLTVVQSLRLQRRSVVEFLHQAVLAHRAGSAGPSLLPTS
jgi:transposase